MKPTLYERVRPVLRLVLTLCIVAVAAVAGQRLWVYYLQAPWTRDGRVRADVVTVAPDVAGLVTDVLVTDNQKVRKGDVLFRIDPQRFQLALAQADAVQADRQAVADEADREAHRYGSLTNISVSQQVQQQKAAAAAEAQAQYRQAAADRALAELNLHRSDVVSPVDGIVTNVDLEPGDYITTGRGVMALVDTSTVRVEGYFEETKLPHIKIGDAVSVHLLGEETMLHGHVTSIAAGIADRERAESSDLLANINPTFSWVRLAQRIPVRVKLDDVPPSINLVLGRTATVAITQPGRGVPIFK